MKPDKSLSLLIATNMYPLPEDPSYGIFIAEQAASLQDSGIKVDILFINGRYNPWAYLTGLFRLWFRLLFHSPRYNLIHAHHSFAAIIARMQWLLPLVVTIHEGDASQGGIKALLARIAAWGATKPLAVNQTIANNLRNHRTKVLPCGINTKLFRTISRKEAREMLGWNTQDKIILFGSNPNRPEKRYHLAQSALTELAEMGTSAHLFPLTGISREKVPIIMNACDALLVTSSFESGPLVVKEALAVGLPVVSVPVGDVKEVCHNKTNCYMVEGKPRILAIALIAALSVPPQNRIKQLSYWYDQEYITRELIKLYKSMMLN